MLFAITVTLVRTRPGGGDGGGSGTPVVHCGGSVCGVVYVYAIRAFVCTHHV